MQKMDVAKYEYYDKSNRHLHDFYYFTVLLQKMITSWARCLLILRARLCLYVFHIAITLIYSPFDWFTCVHQICSSSQDVCICMSKEHVQCSVFTVGSTSKWFLVCFRYYCTSETLKFYFAFVVIKHYVRILEKKGAIYTFCVLCLAKLG